MLPGPFSVEVAVPEAARGCLSSQIEKQEIKKDETGLSECAVKKACLSPSLAMLLNPRPVVMLASQFQFQDAPG